MGRYEILEQIGQGGMAEVFKARAVGAHGFQKVVVVKRILPELAATPEFRELFVNEAKTTVDVSHANIVQVLDLGQVGEELFIALEHVDGVDLADLLKHQRQHGTNIPLESRLYIAIEVLKGLHHAHTQFDRAIVHRDVSPSNILLSTAGEVKISDFGIATAATDSGAVVAKGWMMGKIRYMAPEQIANGALDARTDVYATGVVLYQMLAGRQPFSGGTDWDVVQRIRDHEFDPIEEAAPGLAPELAHIVRTAMALDPADRFETAEAFRDALTDFAYEQGLRPDGRALIGPVRELIGRRGPKDSSNKSIFQRLGPLIAEEVDGEGVTSFRKATPGETREFSVPRHLRPDEVDQLEIEQDGKSQPSIWDVEDNVDAPPPRRRRTWWVALLGAGLVLGSGGLLLASRWPGDAEDSNPQPTATLPVAQSPAPAHTGTLDFDVSPWAHVFIDGTDVGLTPIEGLALLPGPHEITYVTPNKTKKTVRVNIRTGRRSSLKL